MVALVFLFILKIYIYIYFFFSFSFLPQKLDIGNFLRLTPLENVFPDSVIIHLRKSLVNFREI